MMMAQPPCFGQPDPAIPACLTCGVRAGCWRLHRAERDVFILPSPRPVERVSERSAANYAKERKGAKPWEREDE